MIYYFDTSALQHRYIDGPKARGIRKVISDARNTCFVSELTTVEIFSAFGTHCRTNKHSIATYKKMEQAFWKDVAEERVMIREASYPDFQRARHLLQHAGVEKSRRIGSSDAVVAAGCLGLALEKRVEIVFCLEDWTLYSIIRDIRAYTSVLTLKFIGVDKSIARAPAPDEAPAL